MYNLLFLRYLLIFFVNISMITLLLCRSHISIGAIVVDGNFSILVFFKARMSKSFGLTNIFIPVRFFCLLCLLITGLFNLLIMTYLLPSNNLLT